MNIYSFHGDWTLMTNNRGKIKYFENIPAVPKREMILLRLGYRNGMTMLDSQDILLIEEGIKEGSSLCKPAGAYLFVPVLAKSDAQVILEHGIKFQSKGIARLLQKSDHVVLMAATVGSEVTERIFHEVENGHAAKGLIIDSVASQTADAALDWIVNILDKMIVREGKRLTKHRYSPGYGDLSLCYQKVIFEALQLEKLHLSLTEKFMLVPEKSVIAITGVEEKES
jgi:hypothetical protein